MSWDLGEERLVQEPHRRESREFITTVSTMCPPSRSAAAHSHECGEGEDEDAHRRCPSVFVGCETRPEVLQHDAALWPDRPQTGTGRAVRGQREGRVVVTNDSPTVDKLLAARNAAARKEHKRARTKATKELKRRHQAEYDELVRSYLRPLKLSVLPASAYEAYMRSEEWALKRAQVFSSRKARCQVCLGRDDLHVHHITYARLGDERMDDLVILCAEHHEAVHDLCDSTRGMGLKDATAKIIADGERARRQLHEATRGKNTGRGRQASGTSSARTAGSSRKKGRRGSSGVRPAKAGTSCATCKMPIESGADVRTNRHGQEVHPNGCPLKSDGR